MDGALRLMPGWEIRAFGYEIPNPFFPGVLLPGITFTLLYLWPFLEARVTGDHGPHHLLDRPRDRPLRTAMGMATLAFYTVLTVAGGSDVLSTTFGFSVNVMFWTFRVLLFVVPAAVGLLTYRLCRELVAREAAARPAGATASRTPATPAP
jgi:ubiquinol-cytochrome c reductase cytochrome b subunit